MANKEWLVCKRDGIFECDTPTLVQTQVVLSDGGHQGTEICHQLGSPLTRLSLSSRQALETLAYFPWVWKSDLSRLIAPSALESPV